MAENERNRWFALTVKPRHEKAVVRALCAREVEPYLPLYRARHSWSDRVQAVEKPLFPGYVFCRFNLHSRFRALSAPGVTCIVGFAGADTPVSNTEIENLRGVLASGAPVVPWPHLRAGDAVRIERGPLAGTEGVLVREKTTWRLVVSVELLQRSVAVEVDRDALAPVPRMRPPVPLSLAACAAGFRC
jgi:transcription antitermination factor NusG